MVILSPRLALRRWQLRYQAVPASPGVTLSAFELCELSAAEWAWRNKAATRGVALHEEGAELLAAALNRGELR